MGDLPDSIHAFPWHGSRLRTRPRVEDGPEAPGSKVGVKPGGGFAGGEPSRALPLLAVRQHHRRHTEGPHRPQCPSSRRASPPSMSSPSPLLSCFGFLYPGDPSRRRRWLRPARAEGSD